MGLTLLMIFCQYFWTKYCAYCLVEATKAMPVQMKEGSDPYLKLMRDVVVCNVYNVEFRSCWS